LWLGPLALQAASSSTRSIEPALHASISSIYHTMSATGAGALPSAQQKSAAPTSADPKKPNATLEEDDEFEDFPVEGASPVRLCNLG
jgi:hypothetical protein